MSRATLQAVSLCLGYPDEALLDALPLLRRAGSLDPFLDHVERTPMPRLQSDYVATFDLQRRCCLYLTYYTHGDTRKRGMALLRLTHAYRSAGLELAGDELPDHLAVVCEFTARERDAGLALLGEHRAAVELLRIALAEAGSPYVDVVDALRDVLPEPAPRDLARALELARAGPPAEEVGLEPFAPPESLGARR
ncbi:MAG TPA: nitrate reductase molybdenum cofactor assembly chaperone [Jatrophihabitantaceae bacterium]